MNCKTTGLWVFVCGASGAGKDSVIGWVRRAMAREPRLVFARRVVTRAAGPGSTDEETNPAAFARVAEAGGWAWSWQAHGHAYGVPAEHAADVAAGRLVVVNGSREHVASLGALPGIRRVLITAPGAVLQQRLQARGREDAAAVAGRMARTASWAGWQADCTIANDTALEDAGGRLRDYLRSLLD
jgi:ribose 1,5-bisphosphokinase